ncbi:GDP-L-fucose synthase [Pseudodesulfovibrio sp.]|uniref:GDP-L-fucose synthase family protein n=1 Tax=Pseudodesulfovibrio sp. TaxID=2035812 RepID=UPI0026399C27|nr:GDP-L-fucose synthase [Pseudodesulfovibrio sp.]MDD3313795.1 GDP-L-fucose synthase [Pseudodesulfovibrio sp.]
MADKTSVFIAGHTGLVGGAVRRLLERDPAFRLVLRTHAELDLRDQAAVQAFFEAERPDMVVLAAATVGGIWANDHYPADFIYDNLAISTNVIHAAYLSGTSRFLNLGSSCTYPRLAEQPIREEALLTGPLEPTNQWYAVAKLAAVKMIEAYRRQYGFNGLTLMPTNVYGPGDNFDPEASHVIPALLRRFHEAKLTGLESVVLWGTGSPLREFMHVDDLASACAYFLGLDTDETLLNVGVGSDLSIADLARMVADVVGYNGRLEFDTTKPDGMPRKLLSSDRAYALGWRPAIPLRQGLESTYAWFCEHKAAK